jgi:4-aminobutyrate aminotransferase-like enzyme/Ser/Thr protein kinase RdoA (MazF antagonist)
LNAADAAAQDDDVDALVESFFGARPVTVRTLAGEVAASYLVTLASGTQAVLKVGPDGSGHDLHLQVVILEHLARRRTSFEVPRVLRTPGGDDAVTDGGRTVRALSWVPGTMLCELPRHSDSLLEELGACAAEMVQALEDLADPAAHRSHHWDMRRAASVVVDGLAVVEDPVRRAAVEQLLTVWDEHVNGRLDGLATTLVHQDLNDFNVLAAQDSAGEWHVSGVLDMGDALHAPRVAEVAVAAAYAMLRKDDPLAAVARVVAGFDRIVPLTDAELSVLFPMAAMRLCVNAVTWSQRVAEDPDRHYGVERMRHTWPVIEKLGAVDARYAETVLRASCGREPHPAHHAVVAFFRSRPPVPPLDLGGPAAVVDLSVSGWRADDGPAAMTDLPVGSVTRSCECRPQHAGRRRTGSAEPATVTIGSEVRARPGSSVRAPWAGVVDVADPEAALVVLRHDTGTVPFWTVVRGVDARPLPEGAAVDAGGEIGVTSSGSVHLQLSCSPGLPPMRVRPSERDVWASTCPDPAIHLFDAPAVADGPWSGERVLAVRDHRVARSQRSYYRRPPNLVRSRGVWFTDDEGFEYLDAVNNVTHVGHAHPHVVDAARRQMGRLNTNSRFVYEGLARYADRLAATFPAPLEVVFFVCTGSEANDLALRMARACTGRQDVLVVDGAYHGNTTAVTGISPNRYKGPGGAGRPPTTHEVPQPNRYRGAFRYGDAEAGSRYATQAAEVVNGLVDLGRPPAAFIAESLIGTGGQVVLPDGYLAPVFDSVRAAGGLCISDEVQVGMGRLGSRFWGFELQGVVPDIVTVGKPIGNGHPMAAVITTRAIADEFDNGMKYFNTFAGNPVSCAIGMAVLDVMEQEDLQARASVVGGYMLERLRGLRQRHPIVGDVRGEGLYVGIELVRDPDSRQPADTEAYLISERLKDEGVITYPNGELDNVLKCKPPMVFTQDHADIFVDTLDAVLAEGW